MHRTTYRSIKHCDLCGDDIAGSRGNVCEPCYEGKEVARIEDDPDA